LSRRRELRDLRRTLEGLELEIQSQGLQERELSERISALSAQRDALVETIHQRELRLAECRKDLHSSQEASKGVRQRLEALRWQLREQGEELGSVSKGLEQDSGRLGELELRIGSRETELKRLEHEHGAAMALLEELRSEMTRVQVEVASLQERSQSTNREIQGLDRQLEEISQERSRKETQQKEGLARLEKLELSLQRARQELNRLVESHGEARERVEELRAQLQQTRARLQEREKTQQEIRQRGRLLDTELKQLELRYTEICLRLEHTQGELQGRLEMAPEEIQAAAARAACADPQQEQATIASLREAMERLGEVNLVAAEQYKELKERYDGLSAQQEDLERSIRSLKKAIQRIDRSSRRRFKEAFQRLDEEFRRVFPVLFEGGEAHLALTQAEDVLDAGVEIVARPPGKRLQSISLLSGGEKALAAVALIFAMIRIKETPFCLFDEVDAPLDEASIDRFNRMVRELAGRSQFILVTHSKRTMEMADVLYGVTMETPGVSRMMSVRLQ